MTSRLNNALRRLGTGWAIFIEAQRHPAHSYPLSDFPEPASKLVDAERRAQFEEEGAHFESRYFLTRLWLPPADNSARAEAWLYENRPHDGADWRVALDGFVDRTDRVLALVEGFMPEAEWLDDGEILTYYIPASRRAASVSASQDADLSRRHPGRRGFDRRARAPSRHRASAHAHDHGFSVADLAGAARRPEPPGLSLLAGRHAPSASTRQTRPGFSARSGGNGSPSASRSWRSSRRS